LDASLVVRRKGSERRIAAADFFHGIFQTALSAEELLVAIELPIARKKSIHFFHEFARRHGDYAIAGLAAQAIVEGGVFSDLRLAYFAVGDRPVLAGAATKLLHTAITPALIAQASAVLGEELDPQDDQQASGGMRRHLAKVLLARCVARLLGRPELAGVTA
jgi:carbon-monoxide dehydrogenase medium subunit